MNCKLSALLSTFLLAACGGDQKTDGAHPAGTHVHAETYRAHGRPCRRRTRALARRPGRARRGEGRRPRHRSVPDRQDRARQGGRLRPGLPCREGAAIGSARVDRCRIGSGLAAGPVREGDGLGACTATRRCRTRCPKAASSGSRSRAQAVPARRPWRSGTRVGRSQSFARVRGCAGGVQPHCTSPRHARGAASCQHPAALLGESDPGSPTQDTKERMRQGPSDTGAVQAVALPRAIWVLKLRQHADGHLIRDGPQLAAAVPCSARWG